MWHKHSSTTASAAAAVAARTPITIDHQFFGGLDRWREQEVDAIVIRCGFVI